MAGDPSLTDDDLQREIDLVGALVLEATQSDGRMSQERIDEILGVDDGDDDREDGDQAVADAPAPTEPTD